MEINESEIEDSLLQGSRVEDGKYRIFKYFNEKHDGKDYAKFMRNEYGEGGWNYALKESPHSIIFHDSKGIEITKKDTDHTLMAEILLTWDKVANKVKKLIEQGIYLTQEEKIKYKIEEEIDLITISNRKDVIDGQLRMF